VLDALGIQRAHVVGLPMGAFATLHFGMHYVYRALSLTVAGGGYGAHPAQYARFQADARANAEFISKEGMARFAATYGHGPARVQSQHKDPRGFDDYIRQLSDHSVTGSANTLSWTAKVAFASPPAHFAHMIDVYDWADPERVERCGVP
jgi:pimeloyl-ACP methyl ester carboxylesterase